MATMNPVQVTDAWTSVATGPFSGGLQNVGNTPLVGCVTNDEDGVPSAGRGGFAIYSTPTPISILSGETLYVRSAAPSGSVILV